LSCSRRGRLVQIRNQSRKASFNEAMTPLGAKFIFGFAALSTVHGATPAQKVVQMLDRLKSDATSVGEKEEAEFAKYAHFCAKATDEKSYLIKKSGKKLAKLEANIGLLQQDSTTLETELKKLASTNAELTKQMSDADATRAKESDTYQKSEKEVSDGMEALERATAAMSIGKGDLVQLQAVAGRVLDGSKFASFLELTRESKETPLKSNDVIQLLKELQRTFKTNKQELEMEEIKAKGAYNKLTQNLNHQLKLVGEDTEEKQLTQSQKHGEKAQLEAEQEAEKASKESDEKTLAALEADCKDKKETAAEHKKMNEDELAAITAAIDKLSASGVSLSQAKTSSSPKSSAVEAKKVRSTSLGRQASATPSAPKASFLQKRSINRHADELAKLRDLASRAHSETLDLAVEKASSSEDPMAEVRTLLKDLIGNMEKAGLEEADTANFCKTEVKKNTEKRDNNQAEIERLTNQIDLDNAAVQELKTDISGLTEDISEVQSNLAEAQQIREDEKAANSAVVKEAEEGKTGVAFALSTLSSFYKQKSFIQTAQAPEVNTKSYGDDAKQRSTGVLGMLEVLQSDFEKKVTTTKADEATAVEKFAALKTDLEADMKAKNADVDAKSAEIKSKQDSFLENTGSLDNVKEQKLLATAELEKLRGMCTDGEDSYAARVQKRREQIDRLKKTGKMLDEMIANRS